jgi:hypothetical protein
MPVQPRLVLPSIPEAAVPAHDIVLSRRAFSTVPKNGSPLRRQYPISIDDECDVLPAETTLSQLYPVSDDSDDEATDVHAHVEEPGRQQEGADPSSGKQSYSLKLLCVAATIQWLKDHGSEEAKKVGLRQYLSLKR